MTATKPPEKSAVHGDRETRVVSEGTLKRLTAGPGQFALAIGACLLLVLAVFLITPRGSERPDLLKTVNWEHDARALARTCTYESYVPQGLPSGWRPNSTQLTGTDGEKDKVAWHLGFTTPAGHYAALEQSNETAEGPRGFVRRMTNVYQSSPQQSIGIQTINGQAWDQYSQKDKRQFSLVRRLPKSTVIVTGTADFAELTILASSLKPQTPEC